MSRVIDIQQNVNGHRLYDELLNAIVALRPIDGIAQLKMMGGAEPGATRLIVPDTVTDADIDAVLAAHDPSPTVKPPSPDYGADSYDLKQVAQAVTAMRAFVANPSPSAAQVVAQVKLLDSVLLALLKRSL